MGYLWFLVNFRCVAPGFHGGANPGMSTMVTPALAMEASTIFASTLGKILLLLFFYVRDMGRLDPLFFCTIGDDPTNILATCSSIGMPMTGDPQTLPLKIS